MILTVMIRIVVVMQVIRVVLHGFQGRRRWGRIIDIGTNEKRRMVLISVWMPIVGRIVCKNIVAENGNRMVMGMCRNLPRQMARIIAGMVKMRGRHSRLFLLVVMMVWIELFFKCWIGSWKRKNRLFMINQFHNNHRIAQ